MPGRLSERVNEVAQGLINQEEKRREAAGELLDEWATREALKPISLQAQRIVQDEEAARRVQAKG